MSSGKSFNIDDLVFAKVRGYPPWPAKITNLNKNKYDVIFFGTDETSTIKLENLFSFAEHKDKLVNDKTMRRPNFRQGIYQVENILKAQVKSLKICAQSDTRKNEVKPVTIARQIIKDEKPRACKKQISYANTMKTNSILKEVNKVASTPMAKVCPFVLGVSRKSLERSRPLGSIPVIVKNNLLLVYLPTAKCLGINLIYQKPKKFDSIAAEEAWMAKSREDATRIKLKLETGEIDPKAFHDRIVDEPLRVGMPKDKAIRFIDELTNEVDPLNMELEFIALVQQIRESLGLRCANVGKCLKTLEKIQNMNISKLMLLRNPQCVDVIRRLQRYKGNVQLWKMSRINEIAFNKHTATIRYISSEIYNGFKLLFAGIELPCDSYFWIDFCEAVKVYRNSLEKTTYNA